MQIVIDISDKMWQAVQDGWVGNELWHNALANGIPLPKGHGRLIDADVLVNNLNRDFLTFDRKLCYDVDPEDALAEAIDIIKDASTIIKSDCGSI